MRTSIPSRRFKQRLLEGAVEENLEAVSGLPRGAMRRERGARVARLRRLGIAVSILAVVGLTAAAMLAGDHRDQPQRPPPARSFMVAPIADTANPTADLDAAIASGEALPAAIPLEIRTIAIDCGHGGRDGGTSLTYGLLEKDLTLDIGQRLERLVAEAGLEPVMTRKTDVAVSLRERAAIANRAHADLFVSIHVNWLPDRTARGIETYFLGVTDDPFLSRLAASENRDSGYQLADYRALLEGLYADVRRDESRRLATALQQNLAATLRQENADIVARGVMRAPFAVLVATEMPAALAEVACLSNDREARLLSQPGYRQRIADALMAGLVGYAEPMQTSARASEKGN